MYELILRRGLSVPENFRNTALDGRVLRRIFRHEERYNYKSLGEIT
jgi:hypothetical protein